jgi:multiple sugar transport system ATP-binding protein
MKLWEKGYQNKIVVMSLRQEDIYDTFNFESISSDSMIDVEIETSELLGAKAVLQTRVTYDPLIAPFRRRLDMGPGRPIKLAIDMYQPYFFDRETEKRIHL